MDVPFDRIIRHGRHLIAFDRAFCSEMHLEAIGRRSYERCEIEAASAFLAPGDRVLEAGSGIGVVSAQIADIVGAENLVCCEANPQAAELLRRTLALNGYASQVIDGVLVGEDESAALAPFTITEDFLASASRGDGAQGRAIQVAALRLDALIREHGVDALMLDIEGGEVAVLGAASLLALRKLILEVHVGITGEAATKALFDRIFASGLRLRTDLVNEDVFVLERMVVDGPGKGAEADPNELIDLRLKAGEAARADAVEERIRLVSELVRLVPANRNFVLELASLLLGRREWDAAREVLASGAPDDPGAFELHITASAHFGAGGIEVAEALWSRAAIADPTRAIPHAMLAETALKRGSSELALQHVQRAVALCPYIARHWSLFAEVSARLGRKSLADAARRSRNGLGLAVAS